MNPEVIHMAKQTGITVYASQAFHRFVQSLSARPIAFYLVTDNHQYPKETDAFGYNGMLVVWSNRLTYWCPMKAAVGCDPTVMKRAKIPLNCRFATITADMKGADVAMNGNMNKTDASRRIVALVAVLALALTVCVVAIPSEVNAEEITIDGTDTNTLDNAIENASDGDILILEVDQTLTKPISADVTIKSADETKTITLSSQIRITGNVTFENVIFASSTLTATALMNPYIDYSSSEDVTITFKNVKFDETFEEDTIYLSPMSSSAKMTIDVINSDCSNATFVYMANGSGAVLNFDNSDGANLNISAGSDDATVEYGTDIVADNSTLNDVWVANEGTFSAPTLTIPADEELVASGEVKVEGKMTIDGTVDATTMNVMDKGQVDLKGTLKADITVANDGEFQYNGDAIIEGTLNGQEVNTNWQTLPLPDGTVIDASTSIDASPSQKVTVDGNVKVINGGTLTISGQLIINEGATLTLEEGAKVIIDGLGTVIVNGDLVIDKGTSGNETFEFTGLEMTVNGYVSLDGADSFKSSGKVTVNGTLEISDEASAILDDAVVADTGEIIVYGDAITTNGEITNNGAITVDSEKLTGFSIVMGDSAVLDVVNAYGTINVSDADNNAIILENVAGVYITDSVTIDEDENEISTLYLSGSTGYAANSDSSNESGEITITGTKVEIASTTSIGAGVILNIEGDLTVSSDVTATSDGAVIMGTTDGTLTVTGKLTTKNFINGLKAINAANYKDGDYQIYTTLATAIADGSTPISLLGQNKVDADLTIPVGTTVTMNGDAKLTIAEGATMTVAAVDRDSARFDTNTAEADSVIVNGTLVLENNNRSRASDSTKILSDTYKVVGDSKTYTNIYNAIENAAQDETVTVDRDADIVLDKDLTIGQGITLLIPSDEKVIVDNGVTVTVDGTINAEGTYTINGAIAADEDAGIKAEEAGTTVVNGVFLYDDDTATETYRDQIVGAYFEYDGSNAIMPLASVPAIVNDIGGNTVTLYGQMTVGDIDLSAYDGRGLTLSAQNDLTFGSITLGAVEFSSSAYEVTVDSKTNNVTSVTGTIVLTNGSIVLDNVYGITAKNTTNSEDVTTSIIGGTVNAFDNPATEKVFEYGAIDIEGAVSSEATYTGKVVNTNGGVSVTVGAGATLTAVSGTIANITVDGTMIVNGTPEFTDVVVTGTISLAEGSSDAIVNGKMYVGVSVEEINGKTIITSLGGNAVVDGLTLGTKAVAYVSPDATVSEDFSTLKSTQYYLDSDMTDLYVTAYVGTDATVAIGDISITVQDSVFKGWLTATGEDADGNIGADEFKQVYANIITEIYNVKITADGGIGTVAIDGVVLTKAGNTFTLGQGVYLEAGQYEISYIINAGFNGDNVKITVNGQEITGNIITLSGTPAAGQNYIDVSISIYGTAPSTAVSGDSSGDDGLGLTDYLLIILVVLIVIMAIMVAMRLMRS